VPLDVPCVDCIANRFKFWVLACPGALEVSVPPSYP
jgi:hypothetical protein